MADERFASPGRRQTVWQSVLAACLLACAGIASAQEYSLRRFTGADGLTNLSIQKLHQDRAGFLWVSTENGIFRYDGNQFEPFGPAQGLPPAGSVAFSEAPDGSLLVASEIGLYRLHGKRFEKIEAPFKTVHWTQGLGSDGHGHNYIGTPDGLFEMTEPADGKHFSFRRIYPAEGAAAVDVHAVLADGDAIWFGCGTKLCHLQSGELKTFGEESGLEPSTLVAILKDHEGNLWVRVRNNGVLEWPAGEAGFRRPDTPIPGSALTGTPVLDSGGHVMLGTTVGLLIGQDKHWQLVDRKVGLRGGVFASLEDRQHTLWMGTGGRGLIQWRGYREWEGYSSASGLPSDNVYEVTPLNDGTVWVATEGGLTKGQPQDDRYIWKTIEATRGIAIHSLQQTKSGDIWMGTAGHEIGLLHTKTGTVEWFDAKRGFTSHLALTIRLDHNGRLWAATETGLFFADAPYETFKRAEALPSSWFWTITEGADGTMWAGSVDGLFTLHAGKWQRWTETHGLGNRAVTAIGADPDGSVWVGYQHGGGVDRVRLSAQGLQIQKSVQRRGSDGLIYFLRFDHKGQLWAGTERGVDVWDGAYWQHYDATDGLIWDDCDLGGFAEGPDGALWFGTSGGLSHFKPRAKQNTASSPEVLLTEVRVGGNDVSDIRRPSFPASAGSLLVRFAAPEMMQDSSLLFRYRLEGDQSPWTETAQRQLEFARLAPGTYHLQVQTRDARGVWSGQTARFAFVIRAPWYRQGWFIALLALMPLLLVVFVFRIRVIRAEQKERELQRMVDEKTSDLRKANEELLRLTMLDGLTGVANRRHFDQMLSQECARVKRSGGVVSLVLVDADHFKALNDSAGHQQGDACLVAIGQELMGIARRKIDVAARIGGEEFALILPATDATEASRIAERLRASVESLNLAHPASSVSPVLTVSIGVATATRGEDCTSEELVAKADQALYRAKSNGRNRVECA